MSSQPTDPDAPIDRLLADGFDLILQSGHLVVRRVPYLVLDADAQPGESRVVVKTDGKLILPVDDSAGTVIDAVGDHTIWFAGEEPRDERAAALGILNPRTVGDGEVVGYMLSFKPASGHYENLYVKVRHYARILRDAAAYIDSSVTATPGAAFQVVEDKLPLVYRDTNTTRAGLTALNNLFRGHSIAIIGAGGTGSYILDQVAKTWVDRIILIDGDEFQNHNAFRAPGAPAQATLQARRNKAEYFAEEYSRMHTGIRAHPYALTTANLHLLDGVTFAFLAAADAVERPEIMAQLRARGIPFIDVGMGVSQTDSGLTGLLKLNTYRPDSTVPMPTQPAVPLGENNYNTNIQVADLNALNALLAVIEWKRWLGFYNTHTSADEVVYKLYLNEIRNEAG